MGFHRLQLKVTPGSWQKFNSLRTDKNFQKYREKIFIRDSYACQFCGFQASNFQEVIHLDQNYHNNKGDNLVTSCCFCAQCFFIETVGVGTYGGGTIIHLPEIPQQEINALCHVLFCAIVNGTSYKDTALQLYRSMKFRSQPIEEYFGEATSNPAVLGRLLLSTDFETEEKKQEILTSLRLLPSQSRFKTEIETWARAALEELPES